MTINVSGILRRQQILSGDAFYVGEGRRKWRRYPGDIENTDELRMSMKKCLNVCRGGRFADRIRDVDGEKI